MRLHLRNGVGVGSRDAVGEFRQAGFGWRYGDSMFVRFWASAGTALQTARDSVDRARSRPRCDDRDRSYQPKRCTSECDTPKGSRCPPKQDSEDCPAEKSGDSACRRAVPFVFFPFLYVFKKFVLLLNLTDDPLFPA